MTSSEDWYTSEGAAMWRDKVRQQMDLLFPSKRAATAKMGISANTIGTVLNNNDKKPMLLHIFAVARGLEYPVVEQLADLSGMTPEELAPPTDLENVAASRVQLFERIESTLEVASQRGPSVGDLVRHVLSGCENEPQGGKPGQSAPGRWRARLFDVPMGSLFPHVGYHGVEFMRWYGPNLGASDDVYPSKDWWAVRQALEPRVRGMARSELFSPIKPEGFHGTDEQWDVFRYERMEILARMHRLFSRARLAPFGAFGNHFSALLRHSSDGGRRHIFTQPTPNVLPDLSKQLPCQLWPGVRVVVVVGHGSVRPVPVGARLAEALGWQLSEFRTIHGRLTGRRLLKTAHSELTSDGIPSYEVDMVWKRLPTINSTHAAPVVVPVNSAYLLRGEGPEQQLSVAAQAALSNPAVAVIHLSSPDSPKDTSAGRESSAELWERRCAAMSAHQTAELSDRAGTANEVHDVISAALSSHTRVMSAEILPTYLHHGSSYFVGEDSDLPRFLWHPSVGDVDVRAAYEIAYELVARTRSTTRNPAKRADVDFAPSVVRRNAVELRRMPAATAIRINHQGSN